MALGGLLAWPRLALAQQPARIYRVGIVSSGRRTEPYYVAFAQRLRELGFAEGRNLVIEYRTSGGRVERLPELAAELARKNCDVLVAPGTEATSSRSSRRPETRRSCSWLSTMTRKPPGTLRAWRDRAAGSRESPRCNPSCPRSASSS